MERKTYQEIMHMEGAGRDFVTPILLDYFRLSEWYYPAGVRDEHVLDYLKQKYQKPSK